MPPRPPRTLIDKLFHPLLGPLLHLTISPATDLSCSTFQRLPPACYHWFVLLTRSRAIACTRVLVERILIKGVEGRAIQCARHRIHILRHKRNDWSDITQESLQYTWDSLLRSLEGKAEGIVSLKNCLRIVDSTGNVSKVNTSERVHRAGITAETDDIWVAGCEDCDVSLVKGQ
jgi:hypothetical protein